MYTVTITPAINLTNAINETCLELRIAIISTIDMLDAPMHIFIYIHKYTLYILVYKYVFIFVCIYIYKHVYKYT
jgi:hypothetical protein